MRHQKSGKKLSRTSAHRRAMWSNMVTSLVMHERIETTTTKAKELKRLADRTISWGTSVGELTAKATDKLTAEERAKVVHAMRMAGRVVKDSEALTKLFRDIAPRFKDRAGGYTRVLKTRVRQGDAVQLSLVELVERAKADKAEKPARAAKKAESAEKSAE
jgi:large subunit ribosomal protein L17